MKIQSKIYTSKVTAIKFGFGEIDRAVCYPNDIEGIEMVEYTNLSDVWNDINNSTPITNGVAYEYPIIVAKLVILLATTNFFDSFVLQRTLFHTDD